MKMYLKRIIIATIVLEVVVLLMLSEVRGGEEKPEIFVQLGHNGAITSLHFSSNDNYLISSSSDGTAKIWDIKNGKLISTFKGSGYSDVDSVAVSSDLTHRSISLGFFIFQLFENKKALCTFIT